MFVLMLRTALIYFSVLLAMRLMGKRQLGELQPSELVSTILISNLASISIESADVPLAASLIPLFLITVIEIGSSAISFKCRAFADFVQGKPKCVIRDGELQQATLRELRLSASDVLAALRAKDIFDPRQVAYAVVETNGAITAALRPEQETATLAALALAADAQKPLAPLVLEGRILGDNLRWCGKDEDWIDRILAEKNAILPEVLALLGNETEDHCLILRGAGGEEAQT